jgi:hypothetical protein
MSPASSAQRGAHWHLVLVRAGKAVEISNIGRHSSTKWGKLIQRHRAKRKSLPVYLMATFGAASNHSGIVQPTRP